MTRKSRKRAPRPHPLSERCQNAPQAPVDPLAEAGAAKYAADQQARALAEQQRHEANRRFETEPGNAGLPYDFVLGLQQTAYQDQPVTEGITVDGKFSSREDLEDRARQNAQKAELDESMRQFDYARYRLRKLCEGGKV